MFYNDFCTCREACTNLPVFPVLPGGGCFAPPTSSEVGAVIFLPDGVAPPGDWTSEAEWAPIFNNLDNSNAAAKIFFGIGSIAEPESNVQQIAKGVERTVRKRWTLEVQVNTLNDTVYDFVRFLQCQPTKYKFWYWDMAGYLYGGAKGIRPNTTNANMLRQSGETSFLTAIARITYQNAGCDPDRAYTPTIFEMSTFSRNVWGESPTTTWGESPTVLWGM